MPRKPLSEEQKEALRERLAKARAARKTNQENKEPVAEPVAEALTPTQATAEAVGRTDIVTRDELDSILHYVKELEASNWRASQQGPQQGASVVNGKMTGKVDKYAMSGYPDPSDRLSNEPKLQRFAFKSNFELDFQVNVSEYTTIDNIRMREPKFEIELHAVIFDDDTGEATDRRYICRRLIMHEDPEAALQIARQEGIDVEAFDEADFLNEMRYLRVRDWLFDYFYPKPLIQDRKDRRDEAINGKLFETFTKSGVGGIDFSQMDREKRFRA